MRRRYAGLAAAVLALALAASALGRMPHRPRPAASTAPAPPPVALAISIAGGRVSPEASRVPKDRTVLLRVLNRGESPADLGLAGYEDRVAVRGLAPGAEARLRFVADRPGDDFAWLVGGRPAGTLSVTGSHLIEGHR